MKTVRTPSQFLAVALVSFAGLAASAQDARFFRISGPVAATITALSANGYVTWTNAPTNATFTVQTTRSVPGGSNWVDYIQVPVTNPATTHRLFDPAAPAGMALIPAGSFTMGDALNDWPPPWGSAESNPALPLHTVNISAFYMDRCEVTKALWDEVYNWAITNGYSLNAAQGKTNNHPAHSMTWHDAVKWCNARSEKEGRVPAYYTSAAQTTVYRSGQVNVNNSWVKWSSGYRLPTEAEWEKAARGGASGLRFPWGNTISWDNANYWAEPQRYSYDVSPTNGAHPTFFTEGDEPYTNPVGYFSANGYGLYDMAGNQWEWCWDWYGSYSSGSQTDPRGPTSGSTRVFRGGVWGYDAIALRVADRLYDLPANTHFGFGFRSVLPQSP